MTLSIARTIPVQGWMADPVLGRVMSALQDPGAGPQALIVGGAVRNTLMGLPPGDIDIATIHHPDSVTDRLARAGLKSAPTGIDHGTVTAIAEGRPFEVTTLRRDVATDGRRAVVAFTVDWSEDAQRRDFTVNTVLADLSGNIYDPTGKGVADIDSRRIVFVGDPAMRIAEDVLRILRFFRFYAAYGTGAPDPAALAACRAAADSIPSLSRERITAEILRIIGGDDPAMILDLMFQNRIMADLIHPECDLAHLAALTGVQRRLGQVVVEARLAMIGIGRPDHAPIFEKYLILSGAQRRMLDTLLEAVRSPHDVHERLYHYGREAGGQSVLMLGAMMDAVLDEATLTTIREWPIPVFPLRGADVKALGVPDGPEIGRILKAVEEWWVEWDFQPGREACLERARSAQSENSVK